MIQQQSMPAHSLPATEFIKRLRAAVAYRKKEKLDALVIATEVNRYYFTGFCASNGILLITKDDPVFYTDFRYFTAAKRELPFLKVKLLWKGPAEPKAFGALGKAWKRIGFEGSLPSERLLKWKDIFASAEFVNVTEAIGTMRSIKSPAEQRVIRAAIRAGDAVFAAVRSQLVPGMTEWDVRNLIRRGADFCGQGESFEAIVCVGAHGAECHHHTDETPLRANTPVLIDMGVLKDHYCSDMTRSFCLGKASAEFKKIYKIVLEANRKAIRAIRPGKKCKEIDAVARQHIAKAGYAKYFDHSLGHSLGLEIHEIPNFSTSCETILKPGMIITVEPGIYLPGRFGIRIEDVILVTRTGCEVLTQTPKELE
jgi:Xaa-Pro aminopeptidase